MLTALLRLFTLRLVRYDLQAAWITHAARTRSVDAYTQRGGVRGQQTGRQGAFYSAQFASSILRHCDLEINRGPPSTNRQTGRLTDLGATPGAFVRLDECDQLIHVLVKAPPPPVFVQQAVQTCRGRVTSDLSAHLTQQSEQYNKYITMCDL